MDHSSYGLSDQSWLLRFITFEGHHEVEGKKNNNLVGQFHGGSVEVPLSLKEIQLGKRGKVGGRGPQAGVDREDGTTLRRCSKLVVVVFSLQNSSSPEGHTVGDGPRFEVTVECCPLSQPSG